MSIATTTRKYRALVEPFDSKEWTLPAPVAEARATTARVAAAVSRLPAPPSPQTPLNVAVAAALTADDPLTVDLAGMLDHPRAAAERNARVSVLRIAQERAEAELSEVIHENRDAIITEHLRVAGEKLWVEIGVMVEALGDIDPANTDALLRSPDKTRRAWLDLDGLALKYGRVREAMSRLLMHTDSTPEHDVDGDHSEFQAGMCTVAGPNWKGRPMSPAPVMPWPTDPRGRLVWFARHDVTPWFATIAERDAAWMAAHKEQYERMAHQQRRHHAVHA